MRHTRPITCRQVAFAMWQDLQVPQHTSMPIKNYISRLQYKRWIRKLADVVQYLNDNGFGSNTNIIFIGDNGNSQDVAQGGNGPHAKGTIYDYGVHVPLIVNGPAVVSPKPQLYSVGECSRYIRYRS